MCLFNLFNFYFFNSWPFTVILSTVWMFNICPYANIISFFTFWCLNSNWCIFSCFSQIILFKFFACRPLILITCAFYFLPLISDFLFLLTLGKFYFHLFRCVYFFIYSTFCPFDAKNNSWNFKFVIWAFRNTWNVIRIYITLSRT